MAITTLLCYDHEDERMVSQFKKHLSMLVRKGLITLLGNGDITPGAKWQQEMKKQLNEAQMILLFISPSFLASYYHYDIETQEAIRRHEYKEACVIPIILRSVYWDIPPLDKLQHPLPDGAKAISEWSNRDKGYKNIVDGIVKIVTQWNTHTLSDPVAGRSVFMEKLDQLIEAVNVQLQPPPRGAATAQTLQQLSIFTPNDVTLADLIVGWRTLSRATQQVEEPAIAQRRITCGELAQLASQLTPDQGSLSQAIKTWDIWQNAFKNSNDPRQAAMARTFARELAELQKALPAADDSPRSDT